MAAENEEPLSDAEKVMNVIFVIEYENRSII